MRALRLRPTGVLAALGAQRLYGNRGGSRAPVPAAGGRYPRGGGAPSQGRSVPSEPQIIKRLLELFPDTALVPISKWATTLPDDLQEALVTYGGLSTFLRTQVNFFLIRQENGVAVASLSAMGRELHLQHKIMVKRNERQAEKDRLRKQKLEARGRSSAARYVPPSQRT